MMHIRSSFLLFVSALLSLALPLAPARAAEMPAAAMVTTSVITSIPDGAKVSIDGKPVGVTPASLPTDLSPGRHSARFERKGIPTTFADFTITPGDSKDIVVELPEPTVPVLLLSEPSGATVTRNGATVGITPLLLPEAESGRCAFTFSLNGYRSQTSEIELTPPNPVRLSVKLVSSSASVNITSQPAGAKIALNGFDQGVTPSNITGIPEGEASVEISAPGYQTFRSQIRLTAGEEFNLHANLVALPSTLTVVTLPAGARIYLDNVFRGTAPCVLENLEAGTYRIRADLAGHDSIARTVSVERNAMLTEEIKLLPNVGSIRLSTSPAGVTVLIDNVKKGVTEASEGSSDTVSGELILSDIPPGTRMITFSRPGYGEIKKSVEVLRDQEINLATISLERQFIPDIAVRTDAGTFKGMFIEKTKEFYRIETSPGLIRSIPLSDIRNVQLIRTNETPAVSE